MFKFSRKIIILICFLFIIAGKTSGFFVWEKMADFGGGVRDFSFAFSIGSYGYAGTGRDSVDKNDFWRYDPSNNTWTQMADYAGSGRYALVAFSIGNFGYAGTGWSGPGTSPNQYKDFWQYDPSANSWNQKTNFAGSARYGAVGLVIGNKAYVGLGFNPLSSDFWEYDPVNDSWSQVANFPDARVGATGFVIGNKGYVGAGLNGSVSYNDLYEYDAVNDTWTVKSNIPGLRRRAPVSFAIGNYGYLGMGYNDSTYLTDFSQYDPSTDQWSVVTSIGGVPRYGSFAFTINNYGYVGGGSYGGVVAVIPVNDFWRFEDCDGTPVGIVTPPINTPQGISMKVSSEFQRGLILEYDLAGEREAVFDLYNNLGQLVLSTKLSSNSNKMSVPLKLNSEIYFYLVSNNDRKLKSGKVLVN